MGKYHHRSRILGQAFLILLMALFLTLAGLRVSAAVLDPASAKVITAFTDTSNLGIYNFVGLSEGRTGVVYKSGSTIYYKVLDYDGNQLSITNLSTIMGSRASNVSSLYAYTMDDGKAAITWEGTSNGGGGAFQFIIVGANGTIVKSTTNISEIPSSYNIYTGAAKLSNGGIAFFWQNTGSEYLLRIFDASGNAVTNPTSITATGTKEGNPGTNSTYTHSIAANKNGTFLITYYQYNSPYIYGVLYNNDGTQKTVRGYNHFRVSESVSNIGTARCFALPNDNFVVNYGSYASAVMKVITPTGAETGTVLSDSLYKYSTESYPGIIPLANNGFLAYCTEGYWDDNWEYFTVTGTFAKIFKQDLTLSEGWSTPFTSTSTSNEILFSGFSSGFGLFNYDTGKLHLFDYYTPSIPKLAAPSGVTLSAYGVASWTPVAGAQGYSVQLYKDSVAFGSPVTVTSASYDFLSKMRSGSIGNYTVCVTAYGTGYTDSDLSAASAAQFVNILPSLPGFWSVYSATWPYFPNAVNYTLQLYKDGASVGSPVTTSGTTYDFTSAMTAAGSGNYTFTIITKGDGYLWLDSLVAPPSIPLTFVAGLPSVENVTFTGLTYGYSTGTQEEKTITLSAPSVVSFTGVSAVLSGTDANKFVLSKAPDATIPAGISTTLKLKAADNLPAGTYTATVTLSAASYNNVTFTITQTVNKADITGITFADAAYTYDNTPKSLAVSGSLPTGTSVAYVNNGKTSAGPYTVTANISGGTNYNDKSLTATLTINKRILTIAGLTAQHKAYDKTTNALLSGGTLQNAVAGDAVTVQIPVSGTFASKNVGNSIAVTFPALTIEGTSASNYALGAMPTLAANITPFVLTYAASAADKTYDRTTTAQVTVVLNAYIPGDDIAVTAIGAFANTDAGSNKPVTVTGFTLAGADKGNYSLSATTLSATASILPKALSVTATAGQNKTYGSVDPVFAYSLSGLITGDSLTGALSRNSGENVGNYAIIKGSLSNANYTITFVPADFAIKKALITGISFNNQSVSYDKLAHSITITGVLPTGATVSYVSNTGISASVYNATANISGGQNYEDLTLHAALTISARVVTLANFKAQNKYYDKTAGVVFDHSGLTNVISGDIVSPAFSAVNSFSSVKAGTNIPVIVGTVTLTGIDAGNYTLTQPTGVKADILPRILVPSALTANKTYDQSTSAQTEVTLSNAIAGDAVSATATSNFTNAQAGIGKSVTIANITLTGADKDNYTLSVTQLSGIATISPKPITVTATAGQNKTYGSADPVFAYSSSGLITGDSLTGALSRDAGETAGNYALTKGTLSNANYAITFIFANFTIKKAVVTGITFNNMSATYDKIFRSITITGTLPTGTTVTYVGNTGISAGVYNATANISGGQNYQDSTLYAILTISARVVTLADFKAQNKYYDKTTDVTLVHSGLINVVAGDTVTPSFSTNNFFTSVAAGTNIPVSVGTITLTGIDCDNYTIVQPTGIKADILPRILVPSAMPANKTYDQSATTQTEVFLTNMIGGDVVTATATPYFENAQAGINKPATIANITLLGPDKDNYALSVTQLSGVATIFPKPIIVTAHSGQNKIYGSVDPVLTYDAPGLFPGDTLIGALTRESGETADTYDITLGTLVNANYSITFTANTFTIQKKTLTVSVTISGKPFDNTKTASISSVMLNGIVEGDNVSPVYTNVIASFTGSAIGDAVPVLLTGDITLAGENIQNYALTQPSGITGNIRVENPQTDFTLNAAATVNGTAYDGSWTKESILITLSASAPSGISKFQYSTDNGDSWKDISGNSILLNETSILPYQFRFISGGSVTSLESAPLNLLVDRTLPIIGSVVGNPVKPINAEQKISFTVSDPNSGVNAESITVMKGETVIPLSLADGIYSFTTQGNGDYTISAADTVGNIASKLVSVTQLDFVNPTVTALAPNTSSLHADISSITITFNEPVKKAIVQGDIILVRADGKVFEKTDIQNNRIKIYGNTLTVSFTKPLDVTTQYSVLVADNIITDLAGNRFAGLFGTDWSFTTAGTLTSNKLTRIDVTAGNTAYAAVVDETDETLYRTIVAPMQNGTLQAVISPIVIGTGATVIFSTTTPGVVISGNEVTFTDSAIIEAALTITVQNSNTSIPDSTYRLLIRKGVLTTFVDQNNYSNNVSADNLSGALDLSEEIQAGKEMELVLSVENNTSTLTEDQKNEIKAFVANTTIPLFFDISLSLHNRTDNVNTEITGTQNPVTIRIQIPPAYRNGRNYKIIRVHNGVIEYIDTIVVNNYLVFTTDRFSQYAVSYVPDSQLIFFGNTKPVVPKPDEEEPTEETPEDIIHTSYINGFPGNTFRPDAAITRAEAAAIFARLSVNFDATASYEPTFADVQRGSWYTNYVAFAGKTGILKGFEDGSFRPGENMTRAQFVTAIVRLAGYELSGNAGSLKDVKGHWAEAYIATLVQKGVINGYEDGTFRPDASITRAEAVKILNAVLGRTPDKTISDVKTTFNDIDGHWAKAEIIEASEEHKAKEFHKDAKTA